MGAHGTSIDRAPAGPSRLPAGTRTVLIVALLARLLALWVLDDPCEIGGKETGWDWGYEQAAVAQSLARGDGFSDPFAQGTGATAWCAPVYPALLATLIAVFGDLDRTLATALALLQALVSAATCIALWRLGVGLGGRRLGRSAAWVWALHPAAIYYAVNLPWDSTLSAFGVAWFLAALVAGGPRPDRGRAARLGLGFGLLLLVNPATVALAPVVLYRLGAGREGRGEALRALLIFAAGVSLVCAPWMARNWLRLGTPAIRTNLGVEFMVGNNDAAAGRFVGALHPAYASVESARYVELGERAYAAEAFARFRVWAQGNPGRFAGLCLVRLQRFWVGPNPFEEQALGRGGTRRRDWMGWVEWLAHAGGGLLALAGAVLLGGTVPTAERVLLRGTLLLFPLVYYLTHVFERYRFPIEPVVVLLAVLAALRLVDAVARRRGRAPQERREERAALPPG